MVYEIYRPTEATARPEARTNASTGIGARAGQLEMVGKGSKRLYYIHLSFTEARYRLSDTTIKNKLLIVSKRGR